MTAVKTDMPALGTDAIEMIRAGLIERKTPASIQRTLKKKLGVGISQKTISAFAEKTDSAKRLDRKLVFKKTGAELVKEFMKKTAEGEDVSDIQAVLEHAVYIDCLNRYSIEEDAFADWSLKDVIKIANEYKKLNSRSVSAEKISGALAAKLYKLVGDEFLEDDMLKKAFESKCSGFRKKLEGLVADDSFEPALKEMEDLQAIYERHVARRGEDDAA